MPWQLTCANLCPDLMVIIKILWWDKFWIVLNCECINAKYQMVLGFTNRSCSWKIGSWDSHQPNEKTNGVYYASWYQGWTGSWDVYFVPALFAVEVMQDNLYQPQHKFLGWLTHWPLGDMAIYVLMSIFQTNELFITWVIPVQLLSGKWVVPHWSWQ